MSIFRRKPSESDRIAAFWTWWSEEGATFCADALAGRDVERIVPVLGPRVDRLHDDLAWELVAGTVSEHALVVSAEGTPELRALARRWLLAAPPATETWSYSDVRPPLPDPDDASIGLDGGLPLALRDVTVAARRVGTRLDVTVHHPSFADAPAEARLRLALLALDATIGQTAVELWIGEITPSELRPRDGFGLAPLRVFVERMQSEYVDQDGAPSWLLLRGEGPRGPVQAAVTVPLHPAVSPLLTHHVGVLVPYAQRDEEGLPTGTSLDGLRALDQRIAELLGPDGRVVAHESAAGVRLLHVYADGATDAPARLRRERLEWAEGTAEVEVAADPGWDRVRHLST
ncbi:DUF695 domain-containing protein [Nocardioides sp. CER19]|uniref:DUF695 domain-containing protein n=1 Tax=Nocardioides sp. CER19 TaxID=3038538 RepID=UPI002447B267|nr:DUF695 domain-containing protein [Nocardioides sp. CER19]MDH2416790.1 DUF695 domain-containing protein [Nocardioides sp. CER19]